jgi:exonuclease VII large subunit
MADEDLSKELEEERKKSRKLERRLRRVEEELLKREAELDEWYRRSIQDVSPDDLYAIAAGEKMESLTYHLLKYVERVRGLERELSEKEAELGKKDVEIRELRHDLEEAIRVMEKKAGEVEEAVEKPGEVEESVGQRIDVAEIPSEKELDGVLLEVGRTQKYESSSEMREFVKLVARVKRLRVTDASILMNLDKKRILEWVELLKKKDFIHIKPVKRDKLLIATDKLLRVSKKLEK